MRGCHEESLIVLPGGPSYTTLRESPAEGPSFLKAMTNYTVRVGSDVTFTCQVENITSYKVGGKFKHIIVF